MGLLDWLRKMFLGRPTASGGPSPPASLPSGTTVQATRGAAGSRSVLQRKKPLNLDISQFAPLNDAQVHRRAGLVGSLWGNPWFGRRDLIPPPDDSRTMLIDRAMVGHGLLTAEELVEIHKVGLEMDEIRPQLAQADQAAARAVEESREDRKRIKEQKQAEAAERKRRHAEQVAERRRTDIIYLGRGVSRGLADRRSNVEKLQALGLPILATPADAANALGLTIPRLRWLAFHSEASSVTHYIRFVVPKKSGGTRELAAPHRDLARCQQWILDQIVGRIAVHQAAQGFVTGRSTVTNAQSHVGHDAVVNMDLKDFFPSVTFPRVKGMFQGMGYSPAAATILALLCTDCPRRTAEYDGKVYHVATGPRALPQGACTSPGLSNLVARRMDARLTGIASRLAWNYTRYADDLTFSASGEAALKQKIGYLLARVRHIAQDEGFTVNEKKTRVLRRHTAQSVTGIVVNDQPAVARRTVRRLRAILHHAEREGLPAQNRARHPHFESWLAGMIAYVRMVNPQQGEPLRVKFDAIRRHSPS